MSDSKNITVRQGEAPAPEEFSRQRMSTPPVDIVENADEVLLLADLPGVTMENIKIHFEDNELSVEAVGADADADMSPLAREFDCVCYRRTFRVAQGIDVDKIQADYNKGVLTLHLPKSEALKPRVIKVQSA